MSKRVPRKPQEPKTETEVAEAEEPRRTVGKHRQCTSCYEGEMNGIGICYCTRGFKRYYKCDRCDNRWVVKFETYSIFQVAVKEDG